MSAAAPAPGAEVLAQLRVARALGSGSNGVVCEAAFDGPTTPTGHRVPLRRRLALKVMSHFWDANARRLLDCERRTLAFLPPHASAVRVFCEFEARLPPTLLPFLTPEMQKAATAAASSSSSSVTATAAVSAAASHSHAHSTTTQFFLMEYHPATLDSWRLAWPSPMPWHVLHRLGLDLVGVVAHMQAHRVGHLDLKLDNILVGFDGRAVLADFGISRVFGADSGMALRFEEPFGLLMNRLVLAPEVLADYDRARAQWARSEASRRASAAPSVSSSSSAAAKAVAKAEAAGGDAKAGAIPASAPAAAAAATSALLEIGFSGQGIWSVGVILYELACGFSHEPTYPEDGGGVRDACYSLRGLPPVPMATETLARLRERRLLRRPRAPAPALAMADGVAQNSDGRVHVRVKRRLAADANADTNNEGGDEGRPLSLEGSEPRGLLVADDGSFRHVVPGGYPAAFCGLVMSMLDCSPAKRVPAHDALAALQAMRPSYAPVDDSLDDEAELSPDRENVAQRRVVLPDGAQLRLAPELVACVERDPSDGQSIVVNPSEVNAAGSATLSGTLLVPVLLRHWSGRCRLVRLSPELSVTHAVLCWSVGLSVRITASSVASEPTAEEDDCSTGSGGANDTDGEGEGAQPGADDAELAASERSNRGGAAAVPQPRLQPRARLPQSGLDHELSEPTDAQVASSRVFLGGFEANGTSLIEELLVLVQPCEPEPESRNAGAAGSLTEAPSSPLPSPPVDPELWSDDDADTAAATAAPAAAAATAAAPSAAPSPPVPPSSRPPSPPTAPPPLDSDAVDRALARTGGLLVLDLLPAEAEAVPLSSAHFLGLLAEACAGLGLDDAPAQSPNAPPIAPLLVESGDASGPLLRESEDDLFPFQHMPPPRAADSYAASAEAQQDEQRRGDALLRWLESYARPRLCTQRRARAQAQQRQLLLRQHEAGLSGSAGFVDMRQGLVHRCLLALTGLSNAALRDPNTPFPYVECARYAVHAVQWYPLRHETVAAAAGVLRNVSCTEDLAHAAAMVALGGLHACVDAYFGAWRSHAAADAAELGLASGEGGGDSESGAKVHGRDPRCAEDCVLAASNLLRFDDLQRHSRAVPSERLARMCSDALLHNRDLAMHTSAGRLLRYMLNLDDAPPADDMLAPTGTASSSAPAAAAAAGAPAAATGGATAAAPAIVPVAMAMAGVGVTGALSRTLALFPAEKVAVETALHIICILLVHAENRRAALCPFRDCADAVVAILARPDYADDVSVIGLGATVLRNLACGTLGDDAPSGTPTPALLVMQAGAATVLEELMARHPDAASIQENGRCALYNLLVLGVQSAADVGVRAAAAESQAALLRKELEEQRALVLRLQQAASFSAAAAAAAPSLLLRPGSMVFTEHEHALFRGSLSLDDVRLASSPVALDSDQSDTAVVVATAVAALSQAQPQQAQPPQPPAAPAQPARGPSRLVWALVATATLMLLVLACVGIVYIVSVPK